MREEIQPADILVPPRPYVPVVATEDLVFVSGQVPVDARGELADVELEGQVRAVFHNVEVCLRAAGCTLADVVRVGAYLTSRETFARFNEVYAECFGGTKPVRTTIVCGLMDERFLVEMDVIAVRPSPPTDRP
jgi:2-iminobutanoate/2-iminopropanoate deaminase